MASTALLAFSSGASSAAAWLGEDDAFGAFERLRAEDMDEVDDEAEGIEEGSLAFQRRPANARAAAAKANTRMTMIAVRMRCLRESCWVCREIIPRLSHYRTCLSHMVSVLPADGGGR
jgi:hypothetical protein